MTNNKTEDLSFEKAMQELEEIVSQLEEGQVGLEESISKYTKGIELKKHCEKKLNEAKLKVEKISKDSDGNITTESFGE